MIQRPMDNVCIFLLLTLTLAYGPLESIEQTRKSVNLDEFQKLFAGDSRTRNNIFVSYVVGPAVAAAFSDASAKP